ncbi:class I SAM-dependent methyltransferase [uncultured Rhodoblastus sp.]|uniref:class I SAM-dependent methyltransferase n=1 Tax=uncultured Rhodoblastus sp. TaxID=543037 RepID=UPI0025DA2BC2|nr:class I SAM-dependent methyltransferase [uncultured Rhodoblastus sp.]
MDVLAKHKVRYFECNGCGSLQTELPYWLDEAYKIPGVHIDVGQAARVIQTWIRLIFILENIGFDKSAECIDYGGSSGLLTRLMRDSGFNYFAFDLYDNAKYSNYFSFSSLSGRQPALVSAFEVFEHLPNPRVAIEEIFATRADLIVFSTQFYDGQGPDWDYLVPFCGQHVFFYREAGLADFAEQRGYALRRTADFLVLVRNGSPYTLHVVAAKAATVPTGFFGDLVTRIGWGTNDTLRDHVYAMERFQKELVEK